MNTLGLPARVRRMEPATPGLPPIEAKSDRTGVPLAKQMPYLVQGGNGARRRGPMPPRMAAVTRAAATWSPPRRHRLMHAGIPGVGCVLAQTFEEVMT